MEENQNRSRGRPIGSGKRPSTFKHYKPRRWDPCFDLIIIESVAGSSNEELACKFGYTPQHISNILSTEQAAEYKEKIRNSINKEFQGSLKERLSGIGARTIKRIETFVENDTYAEARPFDYVDRMLKIAQAVGTLGGDLKSGSGNTTIVNGNAIVINNDKANDLRNALEKSMSLDEIEVGDEVRSVDVTSGFELKRVG